MNLPPNVYHRLMLMNGQVIASNEPLPGGDDKAPKVFLIVFSPMRTDSEIVPGNEEENLPDGELRWTTPAKYCILMREHDGTLREDVQVHEIGVDKVLIATRLPTQKEALAEFEALLKEEMGDDAKVDLKKDLLTGSNGQVNASAP